MSGLLFLCAVAGFVLIAFWAYRNDAMQAHECGSGLLAMRLAVAKAKPLPKWKRAGTALESHRRLARKEAAPGATPGWKRTFLYGRAR